MRSELALDDKREFGEVAVADDLPKLPLGLALAAGTAAVYAGVYAL